MPTTRRIRRLGRRARSLPAATARTTWRTRLRNAVWLAVWPWALSCDDGATAPSVASLEIAPLEALVVGIGGAVRFSAVARAENGQSVAAAVDWSVADSSVASAKSGLVTGLAPGATTVTARASGFAATARLEVFVPETVSRYEPGRSYFGRRGYVQYVPGELPVVLSAGHGGALAPGEIADRRSGVVRNDRNTLELTLAVREALVELSGFAPHVVLSHLARAKLDPNREIEEAAQGNPYAEQAWREFHGWIRIARESIQGAYGANGAGEGLYLDMHGHGHAAARVELGYLLRAEQLNQSDASLNSLAVVRCTSIRELGRDSPLPFSQLLRGPASFGGFLQDEGVPSVPSPAVPSPGTDPYFRGGYSTRMHGSLDDGEVISGIQLEHHYPGLRDTPENRRAFAAKAARAIRAFMLEHVGYFEPAGLRGGGSPADSRNLRPSALEPARAAKAADETETCS